MSGGPSQEWWSVPELLDAALPGLPSSRRGVDKLIAREAWQADAERARRRSRGHGGGWEYHWTMLPERARVRLVKAATPAPVARVVDHAAFDALTETAKQKARDRMAALQAVLAAEAAGQTRNTAVDLVADVQRVAPRSIWNWFRMVRGLDLPDWLPALAPQRGKRSTGSRCAYVSDAFMDLLKADYLRLEAPSFTSAYRRTVAIATAQRINSIPAEHQARRTLHRDVPKVTQIFKREGLAGLSRCYPPQIRDRSSLTALEAVNADCHRFDVFVRWPDGKIERPQMVTFQDVYSGKLLSWRVDRTPNKVMVMAAWADLTRTWGIPKHCLFDNGREFANRWLTGGAATRFRFRVREDEPLGALSLMGVKIHWATPGHGQAKPVERAFGDLSEDVAKDPRFAGAYVGRGPDAKPENYGQLAVDLDEFVAVLEQGVEAHNARAGRTSPTCNGRSFDETFASSYQADGVTKASPEQLRTCLMAFQELTPHSDHGRIRFQGNHYYSPFLFNHAGKKVVARFDPENLHAGLEIYTAKGEHLGHAPVQEAEGFFDMEAAKETSRERRRIKKAQKALADQLSPLGVDDVASALRKLSPEQATRVDARVVEGRFGDRNPIPLPQPRPQPEAPAQTPEEKARHSAFVANFHEAREVRESRRDDEAAAERFAHAQALLRQLQDGHEIPAGEAEWLRGYRTSNEFASRVLRAEMSGDDVIAK
ncbi:MAG: transposase domain-containing protein [Pseudomonadota bacterium]